MLDELLNEINELKEYKKKYENQQADKERMSCIIFGYEMECYKNKSHEEHKKSYIDEMCKCCNNYYTGCECIENLPREINKPIPSDKAWLPSHVGCQNFQWN